MARSWTWGCNQIAIAVALATALLAWSSGCDGEDPRKLAYDHLPPFDKACLDGTWIDATVEVGWVTLIEDRPTFTPQQRPDEHLGIWAAEPEVRLRDGQPLVMVCFEDCTGGILGPACVFVDMGLEDVVGYVPRI